MESVEKRFLRYTAVNTISDENSDTCPSSERQFVLAHMLVKELKELGIADARVDEHGYVYGTIPANTENQPVIGLIAHMDTVQAGDGSEFHPRAFDYEGGDILLNAEKGIYTCVKDFPELDALKGKRLVVSDGTTVLGADDKAGVAEIMTVAERLLNDPSIPHGKVMIGFTPDEEIGRGADLFDVPGFGAEFAYTVDGGPIHEIEYENFNAASAKVQVKGVNIHPGSAKGRMKNAARIVMEFNSLLPEQEKPEYTECREGFYHLCGVQGDEENAMAVYILRDHDGEKLEIKKQLMLKAAEYLNLKYGDGTVTVTLRDSYRNMKEVIVQYPHVIARAENAIRKNGLTPASSPVRGGTDGARLSFMGLPCPNLGTAGMYCHGIHELAVVEDMERMVDILTDIVRAEK